MLFARNGSGDSSIAIAFKELIPETNQGVGKKCLCFAQDGAVMRTSSHKTLTVEHRSARRRGSKNAGGFMLMRRASRVLRNSSAKSKMCIFQESNPSLWILYAVATVEQSGSVSLAVTTTSRSRSKKVASLPTVPIVKLFPSAASALRIAPRDIEMAPTICRSESELRRRKERKGVNRFIIVYHNGTLKSTVIATGISQRKLGA